MNNNYWKCQAPLNSQKWPDTTSATVIKDLEIKNSIFDMYCRYVTSWNDAELNFTYHDYTIYGANVGGGESRFILHYHEDDKNHWRLVIFFSNNFLKYCSVHSCLYNTLKTTEDINSLHLHWTGTGRVKFKQWLIKQMEK